MKKVVILAISGLVLWSCHNSTEKSMTHQETAHHTEHQNDESSVDIELNNGAKWLVNDEMKPFVLKGEELVNAYILDGQSDYKTLAEQLKDQNSQLIKNCTMQGKSHDELHKWLHPHLEIVKTLENEKIAAKANETILQLQRSYQAYHQYFN